MPKQYHSRKRTSYAQFEREHAAELSAFTDSLGWTGVPKPMSLADTVRRARPRPPQWADEMKRSAFVAALTAAGRENCPDAFNDILYFGLRRLGVKIPSGVFVEPAGRPRRPKTTEGVYQTWNELGQPPLAGIRLAAAVYGDAFKNADPAERRRMIDRCRQTIKRYSPSDAVAEKIEQ